MIALFNDAIAVFVSVRTHYDVYTMTKWPNNAFVEAYLCLYAAHTLQTYSYISQRHAYTNTSALGNICTHGYTSACWQAWLVETDKTESQGSGMWCTPSPYLCHCFALHSMSTILISSLPLAIGIWGSKVSFSLPNFYFPVCLWCVLHA